MVIREREPQAHSELRYLIVGYGNIGRKRHLTLGDKCLGTVSRNPERGADFPDIGSVPLELLDRADAVVVTIPQPWKFPVVELFLKQGKHVLVEKPFLVTVDEANQLHSIAEKNDAIWYTGYNHRFEPHVQSLKVLLRERQLGNVYRVRMTYGFGNVQQLKGTWRDNGYGALDDIGVHLIDLSHFLFGYSGEDFDLLTLDQNEARNTWDHCVVVTTDRKIIIEAGFTTWKNNFQVDVFGSRGSAHIEGLIKWGESKLTVRHRVFPAGVPTERIITTTGPDVTWREDIKHFENMVIQRKTSYEDDLRTSIAIQRIISQTT